jgi:hypothetical protein
MPKTFGDGLGRQSIEYFSIRRDHQHLGCMLLKICSGKKDAIRSIWCKRTKGVIAVNAPFASYGKGAFPDAAGNDELFGSSP